MTLAYLPSTRQLETFRRKLIWLKPFTVFLFLAEKQNCRYASKHCIQCSDLTMRSLPFHLPICRLFENFPQAQHIIREHKISISIPTFDESRAGCAEELYQLIFRVMMMC